jgi:hypothetical protein
VISAVESATAIVTNALLRVFMRRLFAADHRRSSESGHSFVVTV